MTPMKLNHHTRVSILVIVVAALLLELNTIVDFVSTRRSFNEQLTEKAQRDLNESHRIARIKEEVENAVAAALPEIERQADEVDIDTLRQVLRQLSLSQPQIVGVTVGFVPGKAAHGAVGGAAIISQRTEQEATGGEGLFGLYLYENGDDMGGDKTMRLVEQRLDIDYTQRPWYARALQSDGYWSEPYEGRYTFLLMCSYSLPVRNAAGQKVAVLAADVPLRELSQMAAQFYDNQQRAALRNGLLHLFGLLLLGFIVVRAVTHLRRLQAVNAEKERIAGELRVAHDIQQSMIPKTFPGFPERDDVELYATLTPAREVGGDFYDFLIRGDQLFFCIGDVTGKGVPAALLMTVMRSLFRTEAGREAENVGADGSGAATLSQHTGQTTGQATGQTTGQAAAIVARMNALLCEEQSSGYFVTMFVGVLHLTTGALDYCNAGHEQPTLGGDPLDIKHNLPVGALSTWHYEGQTVRLHAGDTLFLYTDRLNEARDRHERPLSRRHVLQLARQSSALSPRQLVELMSSDAQRHVGSAEQSDDITLMAIRWHGGNTLTLRTDGGDLHQLEAFVEAVSSRARLSDHETPRLRLAVEEAVTNVIRHAHATSIRLDSEVRDGVLHITLTDDGQPFDPTQAPDVDTTVPADQRVEGGLGILFMRRMSDALTYRREGERNVLTIKKEISI